MSDDGRFPIFTPMFTDVAGATAYLDHIGGLEDGDIDVFEAALALALHDHSGISVDKYRQHLIKMTAQAKGEIERLKQDGLDDGLDLRCEVIRSVMARLNGYVGDELNYNSIENADLIRVIDRRLGMPITIAVIAIALGRALDWPVEGLNFPGHFLMRVEYAGKRAILDPFALFKELGAPELRALLKEMAGERAELSAHYYEPASNRDILLRLQNNIKHRAIEAEDYTKALTVIDLMKRFAPQEGRLLFDEGILLVRMEQPAAAVKALQSYVETTPEGPEKWQAIQLMREIGAMLN